MNKSVPTLFIIHRSHYKPDSYTGYETRNQ